MTDKPFRNVTVFGGGQMGSGIAIAIAKSGCHVTIVEINELLIEKTKQVIKPIIERYAVKLHPNNVDEQTKYIRNVNENIKYTIDIESSVKSTDLVIEAIVENLQLKHELFTKIDKIAPLHTIFASNTSSLLIQQIASITNRADRFAGLHFFLPAHLMKLLEIICTSETSSETYTKLKTFGQSIGKTCITCKDTPGFVVNGLLIPYCFEAISMFENDIATITDIDMAMKLGAGHPMGPFELMDLVGLDTIANIRRNFQKQYPNNLKYKSHPKFEKLIEDGKFGVKTGEGFFNYKKK